MRYLLFAGEFYYPAGGANDLYGQYNTVVEALAAAAHLDKDWKQIYDLEKRTVIWS